MSIGLYHHPNGMTTAQYDEVIRRLTEVGSDNPPGREYHACFGPPDGLMVFDVWDAQESFQAFGAALFPILAEVGIEGGEPMTMPMHNVIVPPG